MVPLALPVFLAPPPLIPFRELLQDAGGRLEPSAKLKAAAGTRVRLRGYVAELEMPPKGGFWLCPAPVEGDESGGGTADLPPESVFVIVRSSPAPIFRATKRPVEVTGTLQLGPQALPDGTMTRLRLVLDRAAPKAFLPARPSARPSAHSAPLPLKRP